MGELRNNHWHMGLDVRTNAKENYAVSMRLLQGYIAAIGVSAPVVLEDLLSSITPMGFSTLYAHSE
jgi:hypothetical protein